MNTATLNCFRDYVTLKLHFNEESFTWRPDIGRKIGPEALMKRRDSSFFEKLNQKHPDTEDRQDYLVSGFLWNRDLWIGEALEKEVVNFHKQRMIKIHSLTHVFTSECENIRDFMLESNRSIQDLLKLTDGDRPAIIAERSDIIGGVSEETLAILDQAFDYTRQDSNNPVWSKTRLRLRKYKRFLVVPKTTLIHHLNLLAPALEPTANLEQKI
jgi:hypothetical protein